MLDALSLAVPVVGFAATVGAILLALLDLIREW